MRDINEIFLGFGKCATWEQVRCLFATMQTTPVPADFSLDIWNICWPALQLVLSLDGSLDLAICDYTYLLLLLPLLASRVIVLKVCKLSCLERENKPLNVKC